MKHKTQRRSKTRAFTLVELLVVNAVIVIILGVLQPSAGKARGSARDAQSQGNMRLLGAGGAQFASGNDGEIFTFGPSSSVGTRQAIQILEYLTGRPISSGTPDELIPLNSILPNRRYQHLWLFVYFNTPITSQVATSPFDHKLIQWQADPVFAQYNTVPYADGIHEVGYDPAINWVNQDVQQLWAYGSTYQTVPAAWNPNNNESSPKSWSPVEHTPHLFTIGSGGSVGQQRYYNQVAFPSQKVHMFEEFDRLSDPSGIWFAYPEARCNLLFFDGSVRNLKSGDANPGWNPDQPTVEWKQYYRPLRTFPWYAKGHDPDELLSMRYRWTRQGLGGIDYRLRDLSKGFGRTND